MSLHHSHHRQWLLRRQRNASITQDCVSKAPLQMARWRQTCRTGSATWRVRCTRTIPRSPTPYGPPFAQYGTTSKRLPVAQKLTGFTCSVAGLAMKLLMESMDTTTQPRRRVRRKKPYCNSSVSLLQASLKIGAVGALAAVLLLRPLRSLLWARVALLQSDMSPTRTLSTS